MIRYYGFLANRKRGQLLPKVYAALNQQVESTPRGPSYAELLKNYVGIDPFKCPSCGNRMIYLSFFRDSAPVLEFKKA